MIVNLYKNVSDNNTINKELILIDSVDCLVKHDISIIRPHLEISYNGNFDDINYIEIPKFHRKYFITTKSVLAGGRYSVDAMCDVLESFKFNILNKKCIIDKQENISLANKYFNDGSYNALVKEYTQVVNFPNGFNDNGTFILICAGG